MSFWFVCGYLFFEYVRPQTIYPAIDVLPWPTLFLFAALATSFADKTPRSLGSSLSGLLVLYGVIVLLSAASGYHPPTAFDHLGDFFSWLLIYFVIVRVVRTKTRFYLFFVLYMLCNFKMTQHGFLSWAQRGFSFDGYGVSGSPGWFQNSGEFGIQLCIFTPLIIAYIFAVRPYCGKFTRIFLYIVPFTAIASVIASSSRGALVGLVASALWSFKASKYFFRTLLIMGALGWAIYMLIPEESMERFQNSGSDRTSLVRLDRWEKGWATMKAHPLLGIGHKNWALYYRDNLNYGEPGTVLVHNMFIESGTEHGFLGLGTLVAILIAMFVINARTRARAITQNDTFSYFVAHGMDAATLGLVISSCFVTVLYYPYVWIHAAFVATLSISVRATDLTGVRKNSIPLQKRSAGSHLSKPLTNG